MDYMGPKSKEDKKAIITLPIIVGVDRTRKRMFAHIVTSKGQNSHAIKMIAREINSLATTG